MKKLLPAILIAVLVLSCAPANKIARYRLDVLEEYPHDTLAYTQGLFFSEGRLFETTGQYGESTLREVNLYNGIPSRQICMQKEIFGEGSCEIEGKIYMLTWLEGICLVYDRDTFSPAGQFPNRRQGWGLTTDGSQLIMTDGSAQVYFVRPSDFSIIRSITVRRGGKSVNLLNELEYIDDRIWANIYTKDEIIIIDPATGNVEAEIDCKGLLPKELRTGRTDVLNGIAYNPADGSIYITGKYWPRMYKIALKEKR